MSDAPTKPMSRLQKRNRATILQAALEVFSQNGFHGATLDMVAEVANMSKPNLIYYFPNKEAIFVAVLDQHVNRWLDPLREIDANGEPLDELLTYVRRKVEMSREMPRESRLFAQEIVQGAPRFNTHLAGELRALFDRTCHILRAWMADKKIAICDPAHLIFSIWATTQHYADFGVQIEILTDNDDKVLDTAEDYLVTLFTKMLQPEAG